MKILITGASGFIGSYLFNEFSKANHEVFGLVRKKPRLKLLLDKKDRIIISNLTDYENLNKLIPSKIDVIIHAGAYNDQDTNKDIKNSYSVNIFGTRNICKIAESRKVKKLIYFSVLQVYGRELRGRISENSKIVCDNDYSLNHFLAENVCKNYSFISKTKFAILRLGYVFGCPVQNNIDRKTLIPYLICDQAVKNKKIKLMSRGKAQRDFVSLNKLFTSISQIIKNKTRFEIYNVVSGYSFSIKEIANIVQEEASKLFKKSIKVIYGNLNDFTNNFKTVSKLNLYKNKNEIMYELRQQIRKTLILIDEK